jgi:hypothetical protein
LSWKAEYLYTRYNAASYAATIDDDIGVTPGLTLDRMNLSTFKTASTSASGAAASDRTRAGTL